MDKIYSLLNPRLLSAKALAQPLEVFVCGPGVGSSSYSTREFIKDRLTSYPNVNVSYGEDLESKKRHIRKGADLQTLEAEFAHSVDFTVLMLETPGSIAELGTFSMIPNISSRLFVVLSSQFYGAESYIARGPLSLIASTHMNNIIYYDRGSEKNIWESIMLPVCMYKYARALDGGYWHQALYAHRTKNYKYDQYETYISPIREKFYEALTLLAINVIGNPTYSDIISRLGLSPKTLNTALRSLFDSHKINKGSGGTYYSVQGYSDSALQLFNSTEISKLRSQLLAVA